MYNIKLLANNNIIHIHFHLSFLQMQVTLYDFLFKYFQP